MSPRPTLSWYSPHLHGHLSGIVCVCVCAGRRVWLVRQVYMHEIRDPTSL